MLTLRSRGKQVTQHDETLKQHRGIELIERGLKSLRELNRKKGVGWHERAAVTRKKLIDACADLIANSQVPTVKHCAQIAGVSNRIVFYHFSSIEDLCRTTIKARPKLQGIVLSRFNALEDEEKTLILALGFFQSINWRHRS